MKKVEGVQSVQVSLKDGLTILELRPDNKVTLAQLRMVIRNNGLVSKDAQIVGRGEVKAGRFELRGTLEQIPFNTTPTAMEGDRWRVTSPAR